MASKDCPNRLSASSLTSFASVLLLFHSSFICFLLENTKPFFALAKPSAWDAFPH